MLIDQNPSTPRVEPAAAESALASPERWLAFLRIVVGAWFLKSVITKLGVTLAWGFIPLPGATARWAGFMPTRVAEYADGNPVGPYAWFLTDVVLPNAELFANLTALGEAAVGLGLVLGLFTRYAAAIGLVVSASYFLATFWISPGQMGFHLLLMASMAAFAGSAAGRVWGLDGVLARRRPRFARVTERLFAA